ncbi:MAG: pyridoxamine 5'-phosphate oxidase family protein [Burkholderiaceae bacterium]
MTIQSLEQLRALYGDVSPVAAAKQISALDVHCRRFIALSPFLVMSTATADGVDASPKGDAPGFVQVDEQGDLLIPDWPGNRRLDGLRNILANPQVGLLFLVPNVRETLRVNGAAQIHDDEATLARFERQGRRPITVLRVTPREVFLHCAKAFLRSRLWEPGTWPERSALPSMGEMIKDHARLDGPPSDDAEMLARYQKVLY